MDTLGTGIEALRRRGKDVKVSASGALELETGARSRERKKHVRFCVNDGIEIAPSPVVEDRDEKDVQVIADLILSERIPTDVKVHQWQNARLRSNTVDMGSYFAWQEEEEEASRPSAIFRESSGQLISSLFDDLTKPWQEEKSQPTSIFRESSGQLISSLFEDLTSLARTSAVHLGFCQRHVRFQSDPDVVTFEVSPDQKVEAYAEPDLAKLVPRCSRGLSQKAFRFQSDPDVVTFEVSPDEKVEAYPEPDLTKLVPQCSRGLSQGDVRFQSDPDVVTFEVNPDEKVEAYPEPDLTKLVPRCSRGFSLDTPPVGMVEPGSLSKVSLDATPKELEPKMVRFGPAYTIEAQEERIQECPGAQLKKKKGKHVSFSEEPIILGSPRLEADDRQTLAAKAETDAPRTRMQSSVSRYTNFAPQLALSWPQSDHRYLNTLLRQWDSNPLSADAIRCLLDRTALAGRSRMKTGVDCKSKVSDKTVSQVNVCKRQQMLMTLLQLSDLRLQRQAMEVVRIEDIAVASSIGRIHER